MEIGHCVRNLSFQAKSAKILQWPDSFQIILSIFCVTCVTELLMLT